MRCIPAAERGEPMPWSTADAMETDMSGIEPASLIEMATAAHAANIRHTLDRAVRYAPTPEPTTTPKPAPRIRYAPEHYRHNCKSITLEKDGERHEFPTRRAAFEAVRCHKATFYERLMRGIPCRGWRLVS